MLARTALRTLKPARSAGVSLRLQQRRAWSSIKDDHQYSAHATSHGSRANGVSKLDVGCNTRTDCLADLTYLFSNLPLLTEWFGRRDSLQELKVIHAKHPDQLELKMRLPKALGGPGTEHNPEELFAMG